MKKWPNGGERSAGRSRRPGRSVIERKPSRSRNVSRAVYATFIVALLLKGMALPGLGFGDLWFNTDIARGAGHSQLNLYDGVDRRLDNDYSHLPPSFVAPYGPAYYYPLWGFHQIARIAGLEDPLRCDAVCELHAHPMRWGILAKAPHLFAEAASIASLLWLLPVRRGLRAALALVASPGLFYVTYLMGQNDVFPLFTILMAFALLVRADRGADEPGPPIPALVTRHGHVFAMALLGVGGAMKVIPLFFAVAFAFSLEPKLRRAAALTGVSLATTALLIVPFLPTDYFVRSFLLSQRVVVMLSNEVYGLSPVGLASIMTVVLVRRSALLGTARGLVVTFVGISAALAFFTESNPQRGVYLAAAAAITCAFARVPVLAVLGANAVVLTYPILSAGLGPGVFRHISPVFGDLPAPIEMFSRPEYGTALRLAARSIAVVSTVVLITSAASIRSRRFVTRPIAHALAPLGFSLTLVIVMLVPLRIGLFGHGVPSNVTAAAEIAGQVVEQPFSTRFAHLRGIDLWVDPMGRTPPRSLRLEVLDGCRPEAVPIRSAVADGLTLFDGSAGLVGFRFGEIQEPAGTPLCLRFDLRDEGAGGAAVLGYSPQAGGATPPLVGGVPAANPLAFRDRYGVDLEALAEGWWGRISSESLSCLVSVSLGLCLGIGMARFAWQTSFRRRSVPTTAPGKRA